MKTGKERKEEVIQECCELLSLVWDTLEESSGRTANDCFCRMTIVNDSNYRNEGIALAWVRETILKRFKEDGTQLAKGFNKETGRPE